jgi:hypothetical protein
MPDNKNTVTPQELPPTGDRRETNNYLNHGVESLVAMDNPDDSQLGAKPASGGEQRQP